ncbi:MAG: M24 family metallopeptidase, partial [Gammaproteobacteria bacterium]|nr:M24 family metallopeptidase [Gammaproteobacteria bacterium]
LEPGMVLTVEPGIYIPPRMTTMHVPARWRGLGIRIEDDVLITNDGPEVLTSVAPKEIAEIETLMSG